MEHSKAIRGFYSSALARVTRCLSDPSPASADARDWLARRAADSPRNFRPLLLLVDAEVARAGGDAVAAMRLFDEGLHEVTGRPWHHALLAERAARLHLEQGLPHTGRRLLVEARDAYRAWGAGGPAARLEAEHPFLRNTASMGPGTGADRLDLMAILRASRALSSKTTLAGLTTQVIDVLCAMTGATDVRLSLRDRTVSGSSTTDLPASAVRYVQRTHHPLLVADATRDDRFSQDPYFTGLEACSLLVIPVPCQSAEDAVLVLANRRQGGVFSTGRLETVELIAGQLAVSLDNALHYDSLEGEVRARTAEIADRNRELEAANQLKADLIGMLGHEINNPLGTILGSLDLVLTDDPLPPSAELLVARAHGATRRLARHRRRGARPGQHRRRLAHRDTAPGPGRRPHRGRARRHRHHRGHRLLPARPRRRRPARPPRPDPHQPDQQRGQVRRRGRGDRRARLRRGPGDHRRRRPGPGRAAGVPRPAVRPFRTRRGHRQERRRHRAGPVHRPRTGPRQRRRRTLSPLARTRIDVRRLASTGDRRPEHGGQPQTGRMTTPAADRLGSQSRSELEFMKTWPYSVVP
nr:hypothetical protein GCM10020092_077330 [Actinoplanes digitatis]